MKEREESERVKERERALVPCSSLISMKKLCKAWEIVLKFIRSILIFSNL